MSSTQTAHTITVDTGRSDSVWAVAFHPDGMHFLSGNGDGLRRWRISDGQEVGRHAGMNLNAVSVSRDQKWIVCGSQRGASAWDAEKGEMVVEVERRTVVAAIDVAPDSSRFATGTSEVNVWDIATGQRLLGPLEHDNDVRGVRFSPDGRRLATASEHDDVRVFDSLNGDALVTIKTTTPSFYPITPLAWSNDGGRVFATSTDYKIRLFDALTGSQLAQSPTLDGVESIALAGNGKFIATFASRFISFLDASSLTQIGPSIEDSEDIRSIALSPHSTHLATGQHYKGKLVVRNLRGILPDSYGPFHKQPSTSSAPDENPPDSSPSEIYDEDGDDDLLESELPPSTSKPMFNYEEPLSPTSSTHSNEDKAQSPRMVHSEEGPDVVESPQDATVRKRWRQMFKRKRDPTPVPDQPSTEPHRPRFWSRPRPTPNVNTRFSVMAEGRRQPRAVGKYGPKPQRKKAPAKAAVPPDSNRATSHGEQVPPDPKEAHLAQPLYDASQILPGAISVTHQPESGKATISLTLPAWMLCFRHGASDGMH